MFHNYKSLLKVTIPETVKTISNNAFAGCDSLTLVVLNAKELEDIDENDSPFAKLPRPDLYAFIGKQCKKIPKNLFDSNKLSIITFYSPAWWYYTSDKGKNYYYSPEYLSTNKLQEDGTAVNWHRTDQKFGFNSA